MKIFGRPCFALRLIDIVSTLTCLFLLGVQNLYAIPKVFSPIVEEGEVALEIRGSKDIDEDETKDGGGGYKVEVEYGITSFWMIAPELEYEYEIAEKKYELEAFSLENIFQILPQGEYWLDAGVFFEYEKMKDSKHPDVVVLGPIVRKEFGAFVSTLNILMETEIGGEEEQEDSERVGEEEEGGTELSYALQAKWRLSEAFEPGLEVYQSEESQQVGPVALGKIHVGDYGKLKYELGLLFGLSDETPDNTLRWLVEFEF